MSLLQKEFIEFHNNIKLGTYDEDEKLRSKRDLLIKELKKELKDEKVPDSGIKLTFNSFNQGSYAMNTGIKPKKDEYDIDIGVIFNITNDEYESQKLKKLVFDKLNKQHNRTVEYNKPCITIPYVEGYHVDLAIYSKNDDKIHIAWGKQYAEEQIWYRSEPIELKNWISEWSSNKEECSQFRRCVRYLKKWKEKYFSSIGNEAPPSIGLTIHARNAFNDENVYNTDKDIISLLKVVNHIKNQFITKYDIVSGKNLKFINLDLPVEPKKNIYYKMTSLQLDNFYQKIESLHEALEAAISEETDYDTYTILNKIFGDDFPEVNEIRKSNIKPVVSTGNNA